MIRGLVTQNFINLAIFQIWYIPPLNNTREPNYLTVVCYGGNFFFFYDCNCNKIISLSCKGLLRSLSSVKLS